MDTGMNKDKRIYPFNNSIETGLRMLTLLSASFPVSYDISTLVYFDYLTVHSGDVKDGMNSLHPAVPNRVGEIFVRRSIIEEGLEAFVSRGLIEKYFTRNGIEYKASEESTPFLEALSETYSIELIKRASWVIENFSSYNLNDLKDYMQKNIENLKDEFNLEILKQ